MSFPVWFTSRAQHGSGTRGGYTAMRSPPSRGGPSGLRGLRGANVKPQNETRVHAVGLPLAHGSRRGGTRLRAPEVKVPTWKASNSRTPIPWGANPGEGKRFVTTTAVHARTRAHAHTAGEPALGLSAERGREGPRARGRGCSVRTGGAPGPAEVPPRGLAAARALFPLTTLPGVPAALTAKRDTGKTRRAAARQFWGPPVSAAGCAGRGGRGRTRRSHSWPPAALALRGLVLTPL